MRSLRILLINFGSTKGSYLVLELQRTEVETLLGRARGGASGKKSRLQTVEFKKVVLPTKWDYFRQFLNSVQTYANYFLQLTIE